MGLSGRCMTSSDVIFLSSQLGKIWRLFLRSLHLCFPRPADICSIGHLPKWPASLFPQFDGRYIDSCYVELLSCRAAGSAAAASETELACMETREVLMKYGVA